jgi:hypothetical protein
VILVDPAIWHWRGRRWAHLVSDRDYAELHDFAARLNLRRLGFQGDHYDVDESTRTRAIELGAAAVPSRELLRRLQAAGLRRRGRGREAPLRWQQEAEQPLVGLVGRAPETWPSPWPEAARDLTAAGLEDLVQGCGIAAPGAVLRLLSRSGELAAVVLNDASGQEPPVAELVVELDGGDRR